MSAEQTYVAFAGTQLVGSGSLGETVLAAKLAIDEGEQAPVLVFDDSTGRLLDFDFRGAPEEVLARLADDARFVQQDANPERFGPGRPRLGVTSREVSLLPRHWEWLEGQPSGKSAALRKLVEQAMRSQPAKERSRLALEAAGKFMWAMAGDLPDFEEASRALYARSRSPLAKLISDWPEDIRDHLLKLFDRAVSLEQAEQD